MKVSYESAVTSRLETDYLRAHPMFFGQPRFDGIIYQDSDTTYAFANLIFMFVCEAYSQRIPMALVQPLDKFMGPARIEDFDLGLCRLRGKPRHLSRFIALRSVVRGALILKEAGRNEEYLAIDTIDTDMFVRLHDLFPDRFGS
jgi:hypothetical protein